MVIVVYIAAFFLSSGPSVLLYRPVLEHSSEDWALCWAVWWKACWSNGQVLLTHCLLPQCPWEDLPHNWNYTPYINSSRQFSTHYWKESQLPPCVTFESKRLQICFCSTSLSSSTVHCIFPCSLAGYCTRCAVQSEGSSDHQQRELDWRSVGIFRRIWKVYAHVGWHMVKVYTMSISSWSHRNMNTHRSSRQEERIPHMLLAACWSAVLKLNQVGVRTGLDAGGCEVCIQRTLNFWVYFRDRVSVSEVLSSQPNARTTNFHFAMQPWWVKKQFLIIFERQCLLPTLPLTLCQ